MRIIGGVLIAFGLLDMIGSFNGLDVWGEWIRVDLPQALWSISAYIEIGLGFFIFNLGSKSAKGAAESYSHVAVDQTKESGN